MTELLCNYMAFKPFRDLFLKQFLDPDELEIFKYNDFQTQYTVELNNCRPDIVITNDKYEILIEVKTSDTGLTENQPTTYLQHLYEAGKKNSYLIFLVPSNYAHEHIWSSKVSEITSKYVHSNIQTQIVYWNDLIHAIKKSELFLVSEKVNDFYQLLKSWFEIKNVTFTNTEVSCMFKAEIPSTLSKLFAIVDEVKKYCSKSFKTERNITINPAEYGVFFLDENGEYLLYFGVWYKFWEIHGSPLCFGVGTDWNEETVHKFVNSTNTYIEYDDYFISVVPHTLITSEDCSAEIAKLVYNQLTVLTK